MQKIKRFLILLCGFCMTLIAGCSSAKDKTEEKIYKTLTDFSGSMMAVTTGQVFNELVDPVIPAVVYKEYKTLSDQLTALKTEKVDSFPADKPVGDILALQDKDLAVFPEIVCPDTYGMPVAKGSQLGVRINEVLKQFTENGTLDELHDIWIIGDENHKKLASPPTGFDGSAGTIRLGFSDSPPMTYVGHDGVCLGYEIDLATRIGYELNMKVESTSMNFDALIASVISGKIDIACGAISITDERKKTVDYIGPVYDGGVVLVVRKSSLGEVSGLDDAEFSLNQFTDSIITSFHRTFIEENRYKLILSGLWVTITVSFLSMLLGTFLGALICAMRRSKKTLMNGFARFYIRLLQGTPIVVVLMILYYIVFLNIKIDAIIVGVIAFGLNFAAYTSEMFRTGIDALDKGQHEAAKASGFSKAQIFFYITLPQAARHILPVYNGEFISMVKMTSVLGYIAIQDLTKASDIIRSRTFEAFFPLIATAIIYFAITYFFIVLLNMIELKIDPKRRKRAVKGVIIND